MTLSHFFLLPERSTSPSFPLHSQMPFNTSRRKSELIARNSIITSAHLLFCSIRTHVLCLFACRSVRSVSAAVRGHRSPLVLWISFLSATWRILFLHPSWKISPFPHVCSSSLLGRIVRTPAHPKILHLKQNFHFSHFTPIPYFCFPSRRNFWKEFIIDGATFPTSQWIFIPPHTGHVPTPRWQSVRPILSPPLSAAFDAVYRSLLETLDPLGFLHTTCRCFCLASWSLLRFLGGLLLVWPIDKLGVLFLCDHFLSLGKFIHSTGGNDIFGPVSPKSASPGLTASLRPNP